MRSKYSSLTYLVLIGLALLLVFAFMNSFGFFQQSNSPNTEITQNLDKAQKLLNESHPEASLKIVSNDYPSVDIDSPEGQRLLLIYIQAATETRDHFQLMKLFQAHPNAFVGNEKASLLAANGFLILGRNSDYQNVRSMWNQRGIQQPKWFLLDADNLVVQGRSKEAVELLRSRTFEGKQDTDRLIRLAVLHINDKPKVSWEYLAEAYRKDPQNKDIRVYRARLLEAVGKNDLAHAEYQAVLETAPHDFNLRDQLADFYHRQKKFPQALASWSKTLPSKASDRIWLKTIFWNRVITPVEFDWTIATPPAGKLQPLVIYLLSLQPGEFWDPLQVESNPQLASYVQTEQAAHWLRLIQALKDDNEDDALKLLQNNPFATNSWEPELEDALVKILLYRKNGDVLLKDNDHQNGLDVAHSRVVANRGKNEHPLFITLHSLNHLNSDQLSPDIKELFTSHNAFSSVFIAAGWLEAGIQLNKENVIPATFPTWVATNMTDALRTNRSDQEALDFAKMQSKTPSLSLLIAQLLIDIGRQDAGYAELQKLVQDKSETGEKAAWLSALIDMDEGKYEEAKTTLNSQPSLLNDVKGQELLARIALMQNDLTLATHIYQSVEDKSIEAKSYLAKKAFSERNWTKARQLTEELLKQFPNNDLLQQNLSKINQESLK